MCCSPAQSGEPGGRKPTRTPTERVDERVEAAQSALAVARRIASGKWTEKSAVNEERQYLVLIIWRSWWSRAHQDTTCRRQKSESVDEIHHTEFATTWRSAHDAEETMNETMYCDADHSTAFDLPNSER